MNLLHKLITGILSVIVVIWVAIEYLALPAVLIVIGLICGFGWEYYVISMVVYVLVVGIIHLIGRAADKVFDKTAGPVIDKKLDALFDSIIQNKEKE